MEVEAGDSVVLDVVVVVVAHHKSKEREKKKVNHQHHRPGKLDRDYVYRFNQQKNRSGSTAPRRVAAAAERNLTIAHQSEISPKTFTWTDCWIVFCPKKRPQQQQQLAYPDFILFMLNKIDIMDSTRSVCLRRLQFSGSEPIHFATTTGD